MAVVLVVVVVVVVVVLPESKLQNFTSFHPGFTPFRRSRHQVPTWAVSVVQCHSTRIVGPILRIISLEFAEPVKSCSDLGESSQKMT